VGRCKKSTSTCHVEVDEEKKSTSFTELHVEVGTHVEVGPLCGQM
jgi:hypothetical protein